MSNDINLDSDLDSTDLLKEEAVKGFEQLAEIELAPQVKKNWYIIQTQPGHENRADLALRDVIRIRELEKSFGDIVIPVEQTLVTGKNNKVSIKEVKMFPSYIFVEMEMNFTTFELVRSTSHILGFVGVQKGKLPEPMSYLEMERILGYMNASKEKPKSAFSLVEGQRVKILDGVYKDQEAEVVTVDEHAGKAELKILMFNRENKVTVLVSQIGKLD